MSERTRGVDWRIARNKETALLFPETVFRVLVQESYTCILLRGLGSFLVQESFMTKQRLFWLSGSELPWLFDLLDSIPDLGTSKKFEDSVEAGLVDMGYFVTRQFIVDNRGDGMRGKVDFVAARPFVLIALEIDHVKPRRKSIFKVKQVKGATTRLVYCRKPIEVDEWPFKSQQPNTTP